MSLLDALHRQGILRTVDHALAQSLRRLDPSTPDAVLAACALASTAIAHGHAAFDPSQPQLLSDAAIEWPTPAQWFKWLRESPWVTLSERDAIADPARPLVLEHGLLYLRRYREYERRLAQGLQRVAAFPPPLRMEGRAGEGCSRSTAISPSGTAENRNSTENSPVFEALFPNADTDGGQAQAAALALEHALLLITGGPGTGKTTTITRVLLLLIAQAQRNGEAPPRIALAAPTGRAAERMAQSLRAASAQLRDTPGIAPAWCDALPQNAQTLHRLLGVIPDRPQFRHDREHPLPFDVLVIDEASMVDLPLMCKLIEAVPVGARLILLGDPDQLPSVEAGDVLAAIVAAADATAARDAAPTPLTRAHLTRGYRQSDALDLAPLARAAREGDADRALQLLRDQQLGGVHFHEHLADPLAGPTRETLLANWRELATLTDPAHALAHAGRLRLLTALRDGPQGAVQLNARIEEALAGPQRAPYFHGRLLLITENSYRHGLFNGDIGVCLRPEGSPLGGRNEDEGSVVAWFPAAAGEMRRFHPGALPAHTGAFAMTVHKAQGSEFDRVWLLLPRQEGRSLSRELIYTALTRARREVHLCASEPVLRAALARHAARVSGLAWRISPAP